MSDRKGLFQRAVDRLRKRPAGSNNIDVERGPATHPDDDRMHISGNVDGGVSERRDRNDDVERGGEPL